MLSPVPIFPSLRRGCPTLCGTQRPRGCLRERGQQAKGGIDQLPILTGPSFHPTLNRPAQRTGARFSVKRRAPAIWQGREKVRTKDGPPLQPNRIILKGFALVPVCVASPELLMFDNEQPRIGYVQFCTVLGKSHFQHILLSSLTRKTTKGLPYPVFCDCTATRRST